MVYRNSFTLIYFTGHSFFQPPRKNLLRLKHYVQRHANPGKNKTQESSRKTPNVTQSPVGPVSGSPESGDGCGQTNSTQGLLAGGCPSGHGDTPGAGEKSGAWPTHPFCFPSSGLGCSEPISYSQALAPPEYNWSLLGNIILRNRPGIFLVILRLKHLASTAGTRGHRFSSWWRN